MLTFDNTWSAFNKLFVSPYELSSNGLGSFCALASHDATDVLKKCQLIDIDKINLLMVMDVQ